MALAMAGLSTLQSICQSSPTAANSSRLNSNFFCRVRISSCRSVANAGRKKGTRGQRRMKITAALPEALLFECNGVLVDTERDGHRVCFNKAFEEKGLQVHWDVDYFGTILASESASSESRTTSTQQNSQRPSQRQNGRISSPHCVSARRTTSSSSSNPETSPSAPASKP